MGTIPITSFRYPASLGAAFGPYKACKMQPVIGVELRALRIDAANENYENYKNLPHIGLGCWSLNININISHDP